MLIYTIDRKLCVRVSLCFYYIYTYNNMYIHLCLYTEKKFAGTAYSML